MSHLRYPEDMFKVQRDLLAKYHVTDSTTWYQNSDLWRVPADPTAGGAGADSSVVNQPPFYLSLRMPDQPDPKFSLTSVYVPNAERENLTAFMAVDAEASSPDYGQFRILRLPGNVQIPGPGQVANKFQTDDAIRAALLPHQPAQQRRQSAVREPADAAAGWRSALRAAGLLGPYQRCRCLSGTAVRAGRLR